MDNLRAVPSLSPAEAEEFWHNGYDAVAAASGAMPETVQPTWIIQRCTQKWVRNENFPPGHYLGMELLYEDFWTDELMMTREQLVSVLAQVSAENPEDEFKGHNTERCACHKHLQSDLTSDLQPGLSERSRQGATVDGFPKQYGDLVGGENPFTTFTDKVLAFLDSCHQLASEGGAR